MKPGASMSQNRDYWTNKLTIEVVNIIIEETKVCAELESIEKKLKCMEPDNGKCDRWHLNCHRKRRTILDSIKRNYSQIHPRIIQHNRNLVKFLENLAFVPDKNNSKLQNQNSDAARVILQTWFKQVQDKNAFDLF